MPRHSAPGTPGAMRLYQGTVTCLSRFANCRRHGLKPLTGPGPCTIEIMELHQPDIAPAPPTPKATSTKSNEPAPWSPIRQPAASVAVEASAASHHLRGAPNEFARLLALVRCSTTTTATAACERYFACMFHQNNLAHCQVRRGAVGRV